MTLARSRAVRTSLGLRFHLSVPRPCCVATGTLLPLRVLRVGISSTSGLAWGLGRSAETLGTLGSPGPSCHSGAGSGFSIPGHLLVGSTLMGWGPCSPFPPYISFLPHSSGCWCLSLSNLPGADSRDQISPCLPGLWCAVTVLGYMPLSRTQAGP